MNSSRRGFLKVGIAAPAVILTPGLLMPVRSLIGTVYTHKPYVVAFGTWTIEGEITVQGSTTWAPLYPGIKTWWDEVYGVQIKEIHYKDLFKDA